MKLPDISLDWMLVSAVLLLGAGGVVAVLARMRRTPKSTTEDSWERSEERRRRKEAIYGSASYALLFCCAAVAAALSFKGLVGFGQQNLGLSNGWEYLVPFGLDGAAMFCSVLAVREASHGDAALGSRLLVWLFAGASAWFNWVHAPRGFGHDGAPQFFAGMSLSAAVLFDRALKQTRRAALREQGLVPRPLPQIRIVRWLRAPRETYAAWSLMLLEGIRTLDEAVDEVREDRRQKERKRQLRREQERHERARLKALSRGVPRGWPTRGGRQVEVPAVTAGPTASAPALAAAESSPEPAASRSEPVPIRTRPPLEAVRPSSETSFDAFRSSDPVTVDLTAEDDTQTLPRLDSLERKLKDLEQQFG